MVVAMCHSCPLGNVTTLAGSTSEDVVSSLYFCLQNRCLRVRNETSHHFHIAIAYEFATLLSTHVRIVRKLNRTVSLNKPSPIGTANTWTITVCLPMTRDLV